MRMLSTLMLLAGVLLVAREAGAVGPEPVLLWPEGAPRANGTEEADQPSIRVYKPEPGTPETGTAVVICPGGGYGALAFDHEGHQVAKWFNRIGVTGVVLRYRLGPKYHHPTQLNDALRAIRYVRANAAELGVEPGRIGVMGFSAGGHLASTVSTHYDEAELNATDPIDEVSSRPDFAVLCYPVISLKSSFGHSGSKRNLLGENPEAALVESLSNETQVTKETPPTFIFHTAEDPGVPVQNALVYYSALIEHKVPAELHVYQNGPHGVGLAQGDPVLATWSERLKDWLQSNGWLGQGARAAVKGEVKLNGEPMRWGMIAFVPVGNLAEDGRGAGLPVGYSMVARGNFSIPASRGATVGENRVQVVDFGDVQPRPTEEDVAFLTGAAQHSSLTAQIVEGENVLTFELQH